MQTVILQYLYLGRRRGVGLDCGEVRAYIFLLQLDSVDSIVVVRVWAEEGRLVVFFMLFLFWFSSLCRGFVFGVYCGKIQFGSREIENRGQLEQ